MAKVALHNCTSFYILAADYRGLSQVKMARKPMTNQPTRQSPTALVYRLISIQSLMVIMASLAWGWINGFLGLISTLLGGLACVVPGLLFAWSVMARYHRASPQRILMVFYLGEFVKLFVSAILMIIILRTLSVSLLPALTGFVIASLSFWAVPLLLMRKPICRVSMARGVNSNIKIG